MDGLLGFTGRIAFGYIHVYVDRVIKVESFGYLGTKHRTKCDKLADWSHFFTIAYEHVVQCMLVQTVLGRSLNHNTVYFSKLVIVGYVGTAAIGTYCIKYIVGADTGTLAFGGIYVDGYLWEIHGIGTIGHGYLGSLIQGTNKFSY